VVPVWRATQRCLPTRGHQKFERPKALGTFGDLRYWFGQLSLSSNAKGKEIGRCPSGEFVDCVGHPRLSEGPSFELDRSRRSQDYCEVRYPTTIRRRVDHHAHERAAALVICLHRPSGMSVQSQVIECEP